jgi:ATP-dependent RNA helicase RhlE
MQLTTFSELGLNPALLKSLQAEGYTVPTPIQAQAIPGVLAGKDLLGIAQTGTGKTAAFALPILHRLAANRRPALRKGVRTLVLSPTRELATQIAQSFKTYGRHLNMSVALMFGGMPHRPQIKAVANGVDILVATPGRLIQHLEEGNLVLSGTEILVLDEADQMLDMGFIRPIRQILSKLSARRQSLFFSATMPKEIGVLADEMLHNPLRVAVTPVAKTADRVKQSVIHVETKRKQSLLVELFADPAMRRTLVFTRTKRGADKVARHLDAAGIRVAAIHGNKSQGQREAALKAFRAGHIRGLVATDIAARGIDIDEVTHVVNYELPNIPESYVHRIGRTARAGAEGIAISLCGSDERAFLRDIERLTRQSIASVDRRESPEAEVAPASVHRGPKRGNGSSKFRAARSDSRPGNRSDNGSGNRNGNRNGNRPGNGSGNGYGNGNAKRRRPSRAAAAH